MTGTDFDGGTMTDAPVLQRQALQERTWQMTSQHAAPGDMFAPGAFDSWIGRQTPSSSASRAA